MRAGASFLVALRRLRHRPLRSFLLLQGTVWGVAVALFPPAVIEGTRRAAIERGSEVGADRVTFATDPTAADAHALTREDVEALRAAIASRGARTVAVAGMSVDAAPEGGAVSHVVRGPPEAPVARGLALEAGRLLDPAAPPGAEVVLEAEAARGLRASVGSTVDLPGAPGVRVAGVLAPRTALQRRTSDTGYDLEHPMFRSVAGALLSSLGVPLVEDPWKRTDACAYVLPPDLRDPGGRVDWIYVRGDPRDVRTVARTGQETLAARGKDVVALYAFVFPILLSKELDRFRAVDLALFLSCLVMGAVVMASLGLLAAVRRASEIAIHRVEGATRRDVVLQFLFEGGTLAAVGAALGIPLALGLARLRVSLEPTAGFSWSFPWGQAVWTVAVALVVGVLASALPALRAARVDPATGLADE